MQIQKFNTIFRCFFIVILVIACFSASSFMVLESSEFFERFYQTADSKNFGFISALLNEVFLVIMAAVWVPAIQKGDRRKFHPANILIKGLVILLFINTVGGASLNTVQKKIDGIQEQKNRIEVLRILQSQIEDQQENISTFKGQQQRTNTVLATRKLDEVKEELKVLSANQQSAVSLWLDILFISLVRFTIQLANITAVWLASWLYRNIRVNSQVVVVSRIAGNNKKNTDKNNQSRLENSKFSETTKNVTSTTQTTTKKQTLLKKKPSFNVSVSKEQDVVEDSFSTDKANFSNLQPSPPLTDIHHLEPADKQRVILEIQKNLLDVYDIGILSQNLGISSVQLTKLQQGSGENFDFKQLQYFSNKIKKMKEQEQNL